MKLIKGVNAPSIMFLVGLTLLPILSLLGFLKALFPLPLFLLAASAFIAFLSKRGSAEESLKKTLLALSSISLLLLLFFAFTAKAAVITEYNLPPGSAPISLVLDNRSYVWFTEYGSNRIGRLIPGNIAPYEIREFKLPLGSKPWGIAYENSTKRRIWFTEYSRHKIGVITEVNGGWNLTEFSLFNDAGPRGIAIEPNYEGTDTARIWFTEFNTGSIGALYLNTTFNGAPNVVYEWFLPDSNSQPLSIIYVNGKVWFTEYQGDRIGCIELIDGGGNETLLREWPLISGSRPWGISNDTYGNIWVTLSGRNRIAKLNPYTNEITEYLIPTPGSGPRGIIVDPFNNVWFAEHNANKIGKLSPGSNVIVEFELASSAPTGITYAKFDPEPPTENGKIWFTDEDGDMLGRIDPTKAITTATVSTIARALTSSSTATTVGSSTAIETTYNTFTSSATFAEPNDITAMTMT
ncbi:TPA: hypothetical protein EYP26_05145, partial [Candidatus Bathyarchaeota archaeon]|nr:hypothetical protein [Candidatus Bathyarchaeota archaeon]